MGPMTANVAGTYLVRGLVSPRTWLAFTHQVAGLVLGLAAFMVTAVLLFFGVVTLPLALVGLPVLGILLRCADGLAAIKRARFGLLLDRTIAGWPADPRRGYRWLLIPRRVTLFGRLTWREIGYAVLRLPVSLVMAALTITAWAVGLVMITLPLYAGQLPGGAPSIDGTSLQGTVVLIVSFVAGLLVLVAAPPLTRGLGLADTAFARWLLAPPENLAARVAELKVSRERVVDAAEAERRRIERDLHDGAQQRLVALAMDLGRAKAKFANDVDAAAELVDQAHVQAKAALTELRNLVRGVHPPVLTDRGLDAALSGLVAISPIPVDVQADVALRPKPVFVESHGFPGALTVVVSDDGIGGADPLGAGLSGLADRVAGVDGTLSVESPPGGPTIVSAMLPCG
jgi:signal transduction histidine kinase